MSAQVAIVAVGSEMLTPYRTDTNSLWLTEQLNELGYRVARKVILGDDREQLSQVLRSLLSKFDLTVTIGGLGPTEDDVTRECAAEALGLPMELDQPLLDRIAARFAERQIPMSENNRRQAMVLKGAEALPNARGTAPGMYIEHGGRTLVLLPGPPHEMKGVYLNSVAPKLRSRTGGVRLYRKTLKVTGLPESSVDQLIAPIYLESTDVETTILAAPTGIEIHLSTTAADESAGERRLSDLAGEIQARLGMNLFSATGQKIEEVLGELLVARQASISVAESCTGGLIAKRLTDVPGSSRYVLGGLVTYSNEAKISLLGVPAEQIRKHGAVSGEVAERMASGVRVRFESTYGLGITGIAGPEGGTPEKPVGLVYVSVADAQGSPVRRVRLPGGREQVREHAAQIALDMLRRRILST